MLFPALGSRNPDTRQRSASRRSKTRPPFAVVNGDVWTDYSFESLSPDPSGLAHLMLVDNPAHRPQGDFGLAAGKVRLDEGTRLTFSGIAVYRPELFSACAPGKFPLAPLLRNAPDFLHDAPLADALLNPQDRPYSAEEFIDFLESSDLRFGRWVRQAEYSPHCGIFRILTLTHGYD